MITACVTRRDGIVDVALQPRGKRGCKSSRVGVTRVTVPDLDQVNGDVVAGELDIVELFDQLCQMR